MGWFQRLFSGSKSSDLHRNRSSNQAPASAELSEELRALKEEITLLRDTLGGGDSLSSGGSARDNDNRNRRGGRNSRVSRNANNRSRTSRGSEPRKPRERKPIPDGAPVGLLVDYLAKRDIWVYEGHDDINLNEAFEHLSRHLGVHFTALSPFYEKLKRCVANGRGQRIDIDHMSQAERSAAVQFGTLLHRHGMLKDFYYHRSPKRQLRVIPTKDGEIAQFLTGGWLEIFVSAIMGKRLRASINPEKFQLMYNVKGSFSDGREFESDLMACVDGRLVWIECKTGHWQDYSARFRGLVKTFGTDRTSAGLLLIRPPDAATCKRATDMLDMTLMSLDEVEDFISVFLGEELVGKPTPPKIEPLKEGDNRRGRNNGRRSTSSSRSSIKENREIPEDEIPLENVEAAKKLGSVDLDGKGDETPQRRRRRRGGRGRGGRSSSEGEQNEENADEENTSEEASKAKLVEPLPLTKFAKEGDSEETSEVTESAENGGAEAESSTDKEAVANKKKAKRQPKRRGRPKAEKPEAEESAAENLAEEAKVEEPEPVAKEVVPEPAPEPVPVKPAVQEVKSASGTTIAPELAAMMAGGTKTKTDDN
ncbi:MAG: hypothetical protein CMJ93_08030 [Planctomycetes bacterium]|nr:hypothetical protein [Planctomycetota bacterium]